VDAVGLIECEQAFEAGFQTVGVGKKTLFGFVELVGASRDFSPLPILCSI